MRIYVDLDDVLSQTALAFTDLLRDQFGKSVALEEIHDFDLSRSFGLSAEELDEFMVEAHRPERLLAVEPMEGATSVLDEWSDRGWTIDVLTGRPPASEEVSRAWLERHGVPHRRLFFVDKYTRYDESAWDGHGPVLQLEELRGARYDVVVEDSLATATFMAENTTARVLLLDKPWNRNVSQLTRSTLERIERFDHWAGVAETFAEV